MGFTLLFKSAILHADHGPEFVDFLNEMTAVTHASVVMSGDFSKQQAKDMLTSKGCRHPDLIDLVTTSKGSSGSSLKIELAGETDEAQSLPLWLVCDSCAALPTSDTVVIDEFKQLQYLLALEPSSGLAQLMQSESVDALRGQILDRYAKALETMRDSGQVFVFTTGRLGQFVEKSLRKMDISVSAFIDNNKTAQGSSVNNIAVKALEDISDKEATIIIATTIYTHHIKEQLEAQGFANVLSYPVLGLLRPDLFPEEIPYVGIHEDLVAHKAEYLSLYARLTDARSRQVLDHLILYRMSYDTDKIVPIADPVPEQYFDENLTKMKQGEVFVDAGGFDGMTSKTFIDKNPDSFASIYYFEPDEQLMQLSKKNLKDYENIHFLNAGVYSHDGVVKFSTTGTVAGAVSEDGDMEIKVRTIDDVLDVPASFIKMDIEGAEEEALQGAREQIASYAPRLAIAAYHKGQDLWYLANVIRRLNPRYDIYLRHYTSTGLESVLYAIVDEKE